MTNLLVSPEEADAEIDRRKPSRENLLDFTRYTMRGFEENWHHRMICQRLDELIKGEQTRLMVFLPPRAGKSELVSRRLPAYLFGRHPNAQIIACSYSAYLASQMNRDVQSVMDSPPYHRLFEQVRLASRSIDPALRGLHPD